MNVVKYPLSNPQHMNLELAIESRVLGLKSLHYGLWNDDEELTWSNLNTAQTRYTQLLMSLLPERVKTVLDVGAGLGCNARALNACGLSVTAISPDPHQAQLFQQITRECANVRFVQTEFQHYSEERRFDLVLMSESSNYFPIIRGLDRTTTHLNPGGYLLVAGLFRRAHTECFKTMHVLDDYLKAAAQHGFRELNRIDVTAQTAPTLELGRHFYNNHLYPLTEVMTEYYQRAFSWKAKLIRLLFRQELTQLRKMLLEYVPERLDAAKFKQHVTYQVVLFQQN
jgi:MPBQ/MSBQ methyltransferase